MLVLLALTHEGFYARGSARGSRLAGLGLKQAAHPRCTVADGQAGDAMGDELRRRLFVEREPELVPFGLRESYSAAAGALSRETGRCAAALGARRAALCRHIRARAAAAASARARA